MYALPSSYLFYICITLTNPRTSAKGRGNLKAALKKKEKKIAAASSSHIENEDTEILDRDKVDFLDIIFYISRQAYLQQFLPFPQSPEVDGIEKVEKWLNDMS